MPRPSTTISTWLGVIGKLLVYVLLVVAGGTAVRTLLPTLIERMSPEVGGDVLLWASIPAFLVAALANAFCLMKLERRAPWDVGLRVSGRAAANLGWGLVAGALPVVVFTLPPVLTGLAVFRRIDVPGVSLRDAVFAVLLLAIAAAAEELLLRGYFFQLLLRHSGLTASLLITGLLFAMGHLRNPNFSVLPMFNTFLAGVALGYAFWRTGDLWFPIGMHFAWNLALVLSGLNVSGLDIRLTPVELHWKIGPLVTGGVYGPEGGLLATFGFSLWFLLCVTLPVRRQPVAMLQPPPSRPPGDDGLRLAETDAEAAAPDEQEEP